MEWSGFFNSVNGDRKYKAGDFAKFFNTLVSNGYISNPSTSLQVVSNNNLTITVKAGKAWINGYVYINESDLVLSIDLPDGVLNRIDRVVLQYNTANREIRAKIKKGTFASSPSAPLIQRDADLYELGIADIYVNKGSGGITQANITDLRLNSNLCGIASFIVPIDTTTIFNQFQSWFNSKATQFEADMATTEQQFQSDFNTWFSTVKNTLSGDVAGNLLNMINAIPKVTGGKTEPTGVKAGDFWLKELA